MNLRDIGTLTGVSYPSGFISSCREQGNERAGGCTAGARDRLRLATRTSFSQNGRRSALAGDVRRHGFTQSPEPTG